MPDGESQNSNSEAAARKFKIVLTSFEPIPDEDGINISSEVADNIEAPNGVELIRVVLPNDYQKAKEMMDQVVAEYKPDFVLCLGEKNVDKGDECEKEFALTIETSAQGMFGYSDKEGCDLEFYNDLVDKDRVYLSCVNEGLNRYILQNYPGDKGLKAYLNEEAGDYLCNFAFYSALSAMQNNGKPGNSVFIHLTDPMTLRENENIHDNIEYRNGLALYCKAIEDAMLYISSSYQKGAVNIKFSALNLKEYVEYSSNRDGLTDEEKNDIEKNLYISLFGLDVEDLFKDVEVSYIQPVMMNEIPSPSCGYDVKIKQPSVKPPR